MVKGGALLVQIKVTFIQLITGTDRLVTESEYLWGIWGNFSLWKMFFLCQAVQYVFHELWFYHLWIRALWQLHGTLCTISDSAIYNWKAYFRVSHSHPMFSLCTLYLCMLPVICNIYWHAAMCFPSSVPRMKRGQSAFLRRRTIMCPKFLIKHWAQTWLALPASIALHSLSHPSPPCCWWYAAYQSMLEAAQLDSDSNTA